MITNMLSYNKRSVVVFEVEFYYDKTGKSEIVDLLDELIEKKC